jgi:hypothetical protein
MKLSWIKEGNNLKASVESFGEFLIKKISFLTHDGKADKWYNLDFIDEEGRREESYSGGAPTCRKAKQLAASFVRVMEYRDKFAKELSEKL